MFRMPGNGGERRSAAALCGILSFSVATVLAAAWTYANASESPRFVRIVIDYGNGVEKHHNRVPWSSGMTVLEAMNRAKEQAPGFVLTYRGSGPTAFVQQIDGFNATGGGSTARNWLFDVNGQLAERGCGATRLQSGDIVRWRFDLWKPESGGDGL